MLEFVCGPAILCVLLVRCVMLLLMLGILPNLFRNPSAVPKYFLWPLSTILLQFFMLHVSLLFWINQTLLLPPWNLGGSTESPLHEATEQVRSYGPAATFEDFSYHRIFTRVPLLDSDSLDHAGMLTHFLKPQSQDPACYFSLGTDAHPRHAPSVNRGVLNLE